MSALRFYRPLVLLVAVFSSLALLADEAASGDGAVAEMSAEVGEGAEPEAKEQHSGDGGGGGAASAEGGAEEEGEEVAEPEAKEQHSGDGGGGGAASTEGGAEEEGEEVAEPEAKEQLSGDAGGAGAASAESGAEEESEEGADGAVSTAAGQVDGEDSDERPEEPAGSGPAGASDYAEASEIIAAAREAAVAAREAAEAARAVTEALGAGMAPRPEPAGESEEKSSDKSKTDWTHEVGLGFISVTGNSQAVTTRANATSRGEWREWAAEVRANGAYGTARGEDGAPLPIAKNGDARIRGERRFADRLSVYVLTGLSADHLASVEYQAYGEPGFTLTWVEMPADERPRLRLRTDLGFRLARESRFQYFPERMNLDNRHIVAMRVGAELRYVIAEGTVFTQTVEVMPDVLMYEDLRAKSNSTLGVQIVKGLSVQLSFEVRHTGAPAEGRRPTDTELSAGLNVSF